MKKKISTLILAFTVSIVFVSAQTQLLPSITVKSLDGKSVSTSSFENGGKPMVISFWATWCKPCLVELTTINDVYADWVEETGVKLIAISTDDARSSSKVAPFVNGKGWEYEIYQDENQDFQRAMNVTNVPHTFLINGKGEIVWEHTSYNPGDEDELHEKILELLKADAPH